MTEFRIKDRFIGYDRVPLVIAEIGINHGGSLIEAFKLVDAAVSSGVEIIKHQTHIVEDEMTPSAKKVIPGNSSRSIFEMMNECSLSEEEEIELKNYVESKGIIFISTPFSRAAANRLEKMNVPAYKIGSGECNNYPLLKHIAQFGKPIILSTGMNDIESIKKGVDIFDSYDVPFALMHTTNLYPTPNNLIRLGALSEIQKVFPDAVVGLSDHSITNHACFGAVALGASILERHFTDSMNRSGPDIVCSMDPQATKDLIDGSHIIYEQRGGKKCHIEEEKITMDFAFSTVVAIKNIIKGEEFNSDNIWVKRPGVKGIKAEFYDQIIGKRARREIQKDTHVDWEDVS